MAELYVGNATMKLKKNHIDYDKKNCNPENLITLCNHCNIKVNKNRDYWTKHFNK